MIQRTYLNASWILMAIVQLLLILLCIGRLNDIEIMGMYFNTDYLYLPSLFRDIFIDNNPIQGWSTTPAPYFFPDMCLYFLIYSIVGSISYSTIIYAFIQLLLIEFFFRKILLIIIDNKEKANFLALSGCLCLHLFLLAGALGNESFTSHLILTNAAHLGSVLMCMISFYLLFLYFKLNKVQYLFGLLLVIIISILSDKIFIVQTVISMVVISIYYIVKDKKLKPLIIILFGCLISWLITKYILPTFINIPVTNKPFPVSQSVTNFWGGFRYILRHFKIHSFILFFHLCILLSGPLIVFFSKNVNKLFLITLLIACFISFLFPILGGYMNAVDTFRYLMHSYILILLIAPTILFMFVKNKIVNISLLCISLAYFLFTISWSLINLNFGRINHFLYFKPSYVNLIDIGGNKLKNGVSDYWTSKQFYLYGKDNKRVVAVDANFAAYIWQANKIWYIRDERNYTPTFNFTFNLNRNSLLGNPIDSIGMYPDIIYIYPDFYFSKDSTGVIKVWK